MRGREGGREGREGGRERWREGRREEKGERERARKTGVGKIVIIKNSSVVIPFVFVL